MVVLGLAVLVAVAAAVTWHHDSPLGIETRVSDAIDRLGLPENFFVAGTDLASPFTFSFIVAALVIWSALRRSWRELAACAAAPLTVLVVQAVMKPAIDRTIGADNGQSFPSGHASATAAWVTLAIILVAPVLPDRISRIGLVLVGAVTCAWSTVSVVALDWHYPIDAAAGVLTGVGIVVAWCAVVDPVADWIADRAGAPVSAAGTRSAP